MAEETKKKSGRKSGDTLETIGTVGSLLTPILFGPDMAQGIDLGAPFKMIANRQRESAREQGLLDILGQDPTGQALISGGMDAAQAGGLLNQLFTSPDALSTLVESGNQKLAGQIIGAEVSKKQEDPLDQMLKMFQIKMAEQTLNNPPLTDVDKIFLRHRLDTEKQDTRNQNIIDRAIQKENLLAPKGELQKRLKQLNELDQDLSALESNLEVPATLAAMNDQSVTGTLKKWVSDLGSSTGKPGRFVAQNVAPELFPVAQNLSKMLSSYAQEKSGAAVSEPEFKRLSVALANAIDSPALFKARLQDLRIFNRRLRLNQAIETDNIKALDSLGFNNSIVTALNGSQADIRDVYRQYKKLKFKANKSSKDIDRLRNMEKVMEINFSDVITNG